MKNKKIIVAIGIMLVLAATSILVASANENFEMSQEDIKEAIEEVRVTLPFENEGIQQDPPPFPNPFMITTLQYGWNMIGYPNQGSVDLERLAIYNDTAYYTWTEAWEQQIILRFVYGWNKDIQYYEFVDELEGGEGYWMFSYFDCELWSLY